MPPFIITYPMPIRNHMLKKKLKFKIGCDPEFVLEGMVQRPSAGTINEVFNFLTDLSVGQIGQDCGLVELRPKPSKSIEGLMENLETMFKHMAPKLGQFEWKTTSFQAPAGGHIHLQIPAELAKTNPNTWNNNQPYTGPKAPALNKHIHAIYSFFLPIALSENPKSVSNRRSQFGYGKSGDWRMNQHPGNEWSIEIRSPAAEWMTTPKVAAAVLSYLATVHHEILFRRDPLARYPALKAEWPRLNAILTGVASSRHPHMVRLMMRTIKRAIKTFELYPQYKEQIDFLFNSKAMLAEKEAANFDISKGWKVETPEPSLAELKDRDIAMAKLRSINTSYLAHNQGYFDRFRYNEDFKIKEFTKELNNIIHSYKWKMKHRYIIFGLRKGVDEVVVCDDKQRAVLAPASLSEPSELRDKTFTAFKKMHERFKDPKAYYIGVPYSLRQGKEGMNRFIDLMHFLEHNLPQVEAATQFVTNLATARFKENMVKEQIEERII